MYKVRAVTKKSSKKKIILISSAALVVIGVVLFIFEATPTTHIFHKKHVAPHTSSQYTKGEAGNTNSDTSGKSSSNTNTQSSNSDGNTYTNTKGQSDYPVQQEAAVETPRGNFASAHKFSLSSQPLLQSSCETTPKATCEITFTNGSNTVRLAAKTTDDGGAAYWTWKPQDIGITSGTWKIQAIAKMGSTTKTADDALNLEVTP